ncbi:chromate resistance protein ChrB domain-containing protein [Actinoplanes lobatus]|uniref:ChrB C-terminal domain-containing protein n=1 Tax=Actinoplanes lobatus TaxID=113568 RepID=A0A7W7HKY2_9ACTN|nr:chromate resistance protein ChrB domain-containing protein [Actinoplanes lobatus]MBB4752411.1 hypothetical protein [Actinoplanes lobatus]
MFPAHQRLDSGDTALREGYDRLVDDPELAGVQPDAHLGASWKIAEIIHEADIGDEKFDVPEAPGLDVILRGLSMIGDDEQTLQLTGPMFDGLYECQRRSLLLNRPPA